MVEDRIKVFVHPDGSLVLLPKRPVVALRGIAAGRQTVTIEEMNEAVAEAAVEGVRSAKS
jgi:antitoxin PrlF